MELKNYLLIGYFGVFTREYFTNFVATYFRNQKIKLCVKLTKRDICLFSKVLGGLLEFIVFGECEVLNRQSHKSSKVGTSLPSPT